MSLNHMFKLKELRFFSCGFCHSVKFEDIFPLWLPQGLLQNGGYADSKSKKKRQCSQRSYYTVVLFSVHTVFSYVAM